MMNPPERGGSDEGFRDERLDEALRQQLGLTDDTVLNNQKIDQAIAFLEAVERTHARNQATPPSADAIVRRPHFERARRHLAQWWRAQRIARAGAAVAAVVGLAALGIGGYLFQTSRPEPATSEPVWRGEAPGSTWRVNDPVLEASALADSLTTMRCGATVRAVRTVSYVDVDLEAPGCDGVQAKAMLAKYGLTVQPNGRASLRIETKATTGK